MVAAAIGAIVMAGMVTFINQFGKSRAGARNSVDFDFIRQNILLAVNSKQTCSQAFWSSANARLAVPSPFSTGAEVDVPLLKLSGQTLIDMSNPRLADGLVAKQLRLKALAPSTVEIISGVNYNATMVALTLDADKTGEAFGRPKFQQVFNLKIYANPAHGNVIESCSGSSAETAATLTAYCGSGTFMIGINEDGPICASSGNDHLRWTQDKPADATPVACNPGIGSSGKPGRTLSCVGKKGSCSYADGTWKWQSVKTARAPTECKGGVDIDAPAPGSLTVDADALIPAGVDPLDYDITCKADQPAAPGKSSTKGKGKGTATKKVTWAPPVCDNVVNSDLPKIPDEAVAGDCYLVDSQWEYVQETDAKHSDLQSTKCSGGLLLEPL